LDQQDFIIMTERRNTIASIFDQCSPNITAFHINEWIHETLQLEEDAVSMIQIDGTRRRVYIKFVTEMQMRHVLSKTNGIQDFKHDNGEISQVHIEIAGMGMRTIRIANLPPEVQDNVIRNALGTYGDITEFKEELWTHRYRYKVSNGIRLVNMNVKQHIPSHMQVADHRVLISYDGQPATCYGYNATGHQYMHCPSRQGAIQRTDTPRMDTWAAIAASTNMPRNTDDMQQTDVTQAYTENDKKVSDDNETPQQTDGIMIIEETLIAPRTVGKPDDTVLPKPDVHINEDGKERDPNPFDLNPPTLLTPSHVPNEAAAPKKDPQKPRREDRPYTQDTPCPHDDTNLQMTALHDSPKKSKKLRTDHDAVSTRERTRSRTRAVLPQTQVPT
jgi:hypothetical protein